MLSSLRDILALPSTGNHPRFARILCATHKNVIVPTGHKKKIVDFSSQNEVLLRLFFYERSEWRVASVISAFISGTPCEGQKAFSSRTKFKDFNSRPKGEDFSSQSFALRTPVRARSTRKRGWFFVEPGLAFSGTLSEAIAPCRRSAYKFVEHNNRGLPRFARKKARCNFSAIKQDYFLTHYWKKLLVSFLNMLLMAVKPKSRRRSKP